MAIDGDFNIQEFNERFEQNKRRRRADSQAAADNDQNSDAVLPSLSPGDLIPLDSANEGDDAHHGKSVEPDREAVILDPRPRIKLPGDDRLLSVVASDSDLAPALAGFGGHHTAST